MLPILMAGLPGAAQAQGLECAFTMVCAPQIGCEPHDGVPFDLSMTEDGEFGFERGTQGYFAVPRTRDTGPLTLLFEDDAGSLLFSLSAEGSAVLTEHRRTGAGRVEHSSFSGTCEVV